MKPNSKPDVRQTIIAVFLLCLSCYMAASSYRINLSARWKEEFAVPTMEANPSQLTLVESNPNVPLPVDAVKLNARYACLTDAASGRILFEKNGNQPVPMASTTKIMTCIVALENGALEDEVAVSHRASIMPDVQLNIREGERYKLKDLLFSLMLESHNDSAVAIAEHVGGSVEGFAAKMNAKAAELGCTQTNFVTPNGLDADGHQTTAVELSRIAGYAIANPTFIEISNTPSYSFTELTGGRKFTVNNINRFLTSYEGAIGIKTGFTSKAGYCFVGAARRDDRTFVSVVLASGWPPHKNYKWTDTTQLMDFGMTNFNYRDIFHSNIPLQPLPVRDGQGNQTPLALEGSIRLLWGESDSATVTLEIPTELKAPVEANMTIGKADFYINGTLVQSFPVQATESVKKVTLPYCMKKVLSYFLP